MKNFVLNTIFILLSIMLNTLFYFCFKQGKCINLVIFTWVLINIYLGIAWSYFGRELNKK